MTEPDRAAPGEIAVFGAYGHTGRFVVAELCRRGWSPIAAGRDAARLHEVGRGHPGVRTRPAAIDDPGSLADALAGARLVVNCAGPFAETAPALVEAALRAGIDYVDVSAESLVSLDTFARYGTRAADAGRVVAPSVGFFGALGDLLATSAIGDWEHADEIEIAVALDGWQPTRGTREAGRRRAGRRVLWSDGRIVVRTPDEPVPAGRRRFPDPVGEQEVLGELSTADAVTISRHLATRHVHAYINRKPLEDLADPDTPGPQAADGSGRSAQTFLVEVVARRDGEERRRVARGRDIYAITAPIVAEAAGRIVAGRIRKTGAVALGELFDADDVLQALAPHLVVERGSA